MFNINVQRRNSSYDVEKNISIESGLMFHFCEQNNWSENDSNFTFISKKIR